MSKSLGNFTNLLDLIETSDPRAYRLLVLQSHYRVPIEVSKETAGAAARALERLDTFARRFVGAKGGAVDEAALERFRERMDDDLDTPAAMALLFDLVRRANSDEDEQAAATAFEIAGAVGLVLRTASGDVDDDALGIARRRDEARDAKDWALADALRDELQPLGYEVSDTPSGTSLRKR
jgi:cysteinyl-tRNA synthetase